MGAELYPVRQVNARRSRGTAGAAWAPYATVISHCSADAYRSPCEKLIRLSHGQRPVNPAKTALPGTISTHKNPRRAIFYGQLLGLNDRLFRPQGVEVGGPSCRRAGLPPSPVGATQPLGTPSGRVANARRMFPPYPHFVISVTYSFCGLYGDSEVSPW